MDGNNFNPDTFENAVADIIRGGGVSPNVFLNRPHSSESNLAAFVVSHISGSIRDRGALGECTFSISLFAKDVGNMKNGKKLSVMQDALYSCLPYEVGRIVFQPFSFNVLGDTPDGNGYHARVITIKAFLKIV